MHPYQVERQTENVLVFGDTAKPVLSRVELLRIKWISGGGREGGKGRGGREGGKGRGEGGKGRGEGGKGREGGKRRGGKRGEEEGGFRTFIKKGLTVHVHCRPELSRGGTTGWSCSTDH